MRGRSSASSTRGFAISNDEIDAEGVTIQAESKAVHKLDVMTSTQFNRLCIINVVITVLTFIHVLALYLSCQTVWKGSVTMKGVSGEALKLQTCDPSKVYMIVLYIVDLVTRCGLIVLSIMFLVRIWLSSKVHRSEEQVF